MPVIALDSFDAMIGFGGSPGSAGQVVMQYVLLGGIAFFVGITSYLLHPLTARVARKAWIFPLGLFVLAVCWDLQAGLTWRFVISEYIAFLPGNTNSSEPWDGYFMFSFPVVAAISYAMGSLFAGARAPKTLIPTLKPD
jgi:hypothetical protein